MQLNVVNGKGFPVLGREVGVRMRQSFSLVLVTKITVLFSSQPLLIWFILVIHGCVDIGDSSLSYALRIGLYSPFVISARAG